MRKAVGLLGVCLLAAAPAKAVVLAQWTFESTAPSGAGPYSPEVGSGEARGFHTGAAVYSAPVGNASAASYSSNTWAVGDYYQFSTSAAGFQGLTIQFDTVSSNTGPRDYNVQWSTNGTTFANFATYTSRANSSPNWSNSGSPIAQDVKGPFAGPGSLDNQATIYFRLTMSSTVSANGGTVASGGTNRVDNVIIGGTPVPEPATLALLALGGLGLARRGR